MSRKNMRFMSSKAQEIKTESNKIEENNMNASYNAVELAAINSFSDEGQRQGVTQMIDMINNTKAMEDMPPVVVAGVIEVLYSMNSRGRMTEEFKTYLESVKSELGKYDPESATRISETIIKGCKEGKSLETVIAESLHVCLEEVEGDALKTIEENLTKKEEKEMDMATQNAQMASMQAMAQNLQQSAQQANAAVQQANQQAFTNHQNVQCGLKAAEDKRVFDNAKDGIAKQSDNKWIAPVVSAAAAVGIAGFDMITEGDTSMTRILGTVAAGTVAAGVTWFAQTKIEDQTTALGAGVLIGAASGAGARMAVNHFTSQNVEEAYDL